ncbi:MAG: metal-dependent hydrolase [Polyangiales bacterium]
MNARLQAITVRRPSFDVSNVPVWWNGGDPVMTRFFDALAVHFPEGERFFIQSVRNFQDRIEDPGLKGDVQAFFKQEAQHGLAHDAYNAVMSAQGVHVDAILSQMKQVLRFAQRHLPHDQQLALTAAFEHITATLGEGFLEGDGAMLVRADPVMRAMFLWHGVEEVEHKAVAFDVYQRVVGGGYITRATALVVGTALVHVIVGRVMWHMLKVDGVAGDPRVVARGLWRLYGPRGHLTRLVRPYLAWFRPGFHPWDTGVPDKVQEWLAAYETNRDPMAACEAVFPSPA